ncbi:hypothetical protein Pyn_37765 [Prunus yedoensis var. nudiflora]|uniref:Uncharacterized protein n=1 Tax=Prunus yedoensis var. nudiflora TaxID=2094558 RepID=A0A314Z4N6_PRUYE|nr:hypothetical protein Pyn_37765 [Prunus yedoensis var. nudiflora]
MARGNGQGGRGISRGRGNVAQATVYQNSQQSVARGRGHGGANLDNTSHDNNMAWKYGKFLLRVSYVVYFGICTFLGKGILCNCF